MAHTGAGSKSKGNRGIVFRFLFLHTALWGAAAALLGSVLASLFSLPVLPLALNMGGCAAFLGGFLGGNVVSLPKGLLTWPFEPTKEGKATHLFFSRDPKGALSLLRKRGKTGLLFLRAKPGKLGCRKNFKKICQNP